MVRLSFFLLEGIHVQMFRNQMLAVMVLSQHCVSTSKTVSPRIPVRATYFLWLDYDRSTEIYYIILDNDPSQFFNNL